MTLPFDIVGFDLDGTLLDTSADLAAAVNHALALAGRPPLSPDQVKPMIGLGAKHMLAEGLAATGGDPPQGFRPLYKDMLRFYEANVAVATRPYDGALAALDTLAGQGVKLAIVTNKFEALAVKLLDALGLMPRFGTVIGGDTLGPGNAKPSPAPIHTMIARLGGGRAVFVGDSIYDMQAARAAGIPAIAVSFGFIHGTVEELRADAVIDHYDALVPTLGALG
ncbi:HAD-IA family hydrolase [Sphingomonas sp.]|uniref:HAD-IA family hydrolase n=1 Tax=Sphingomonas sp. TaxID=28214 RepID=UPI001D590FAC|nr:HAD-IA family hydrolase [Sphingomonas sp.]MBX9795731.1 HAD-IA family hydrolase [Sphingomonas sp.]